MASTFSELAQSTRDAGDAVRQFLPVIVDRRCGPLCERRNRRAGGAREVR